jgi:hypothetical protein
MPVLVPPLLVPLMPELLRLALLMPVWLLLLIRPLPLLPLHLPLLLRLLPLLRLLLLRRPLLPLRRLRRWRL